MPNAELTFHSQISLHYSPPLKELSPLRSDVGNIRRWHAAVTTDFHSSQKYGAEILSRQISIFTHDCQIWLPPAKVGRIGVALNACHTTLYSSSVIPFCAPSRSPHLNKNISSMLGCPREACRSVGGAGQGGVLSAHCNRTCDLTKLEMSASRSAFFRMPCAHCRMSVLPKHVRSQMRATLIGALSIFSVNSFYFVLFHGCFSG